MFLKSLTISAGTNIIREIKFHEGVNLIVDETPYDTGKESGNGVGKTTILMLIDFCLGADSKNIYLEQENKKEVKFVKDFLINQKVLITLILKKDLSDKFSREVCIEKNFLSRKNKIQQINGNPKTDSEFEEELTRLLIPNHDEKKPSFRQIISHNIRYKEASVDNTLKTLNKYTSDAEYESLYLFLLGCDFKKGEDKQALLKRIELENKFKRRLEESQTRSAYEIALSLLEDEIEILAAKKSNFNLNKDFEADLDKLNNIKYQINRLISEIGKLNIKRNLICEAEEDLKSNNFKVDLKQLELIYSQATSKINGIQKTFEEMVAFHNQMIDEKVRYIAKDLPKLNDEINAKKMHLKYLLQEETDLSKIIARSESFEELEKLIAELNEKYRQKGEYEKTIQQLSEVESKLNQLQEQLDNIDCELFSPKFELIIKEQINKFNKHFSSISHELYGEKYALKFDKITDTKGRHLYKFDTFQANLSTGKKQGEISCFDIAYTLFADEEKIPCLHFLLYDKKELMHDNQLLKIAELVNDKKIQLVASILKDKLPDELNQEKYFVIKLSQTEKLFRIEQMGSTLE